MFNFEIFDTKRRAWDVLRNCYWNAFVVAIISSLLAGLGSGILSKIQEVLYFFVFGAFADDIDAFVAFVNEMPEDPASMNAYMSQVDIQQVIDLCLPIFEMFAIFYVIAIILSYLINTLASEPIMVGMRKSYLALHGSGQNPELKLEYVCDGFSKNYANVVKVSALKLAYIFIGYIFFLIPGLVLYYRYMMVPYILAENPNIGAKRALSISRLMMRGNKFKMFLMQLSFLGWFFVGMMACGFGMLFVMPYYFMAETDAYYQLRSQVIASGYVHEMELSGVQVF